MADFRAIHASVDGGAILVDFETNTSGVMGWQLYDPATGAFLQEGEWSQQRNGAVSLRIALPEEEGPYRVQVAPVADRGRFISIDARVAPGSVKIETPRVANLRAEQFGQAIRTLPKLFTRPLQSIASNRKLIASMVRRDILARYRGSFGGALWTFLTPLLLMLTYFFVFGVVLKTRFSQDQSASGYVLYFLAGMLPWLAFSEAVGRSPSVILEYRTFVKKLVFPLETLPVNLTLAGLVTEAVGIVIFLLGLWLARGGVPPTVLWLPALLIPQVLFTVGLSWILAATGVFVRDLGQVIGFLLTLWFFLTPICYEESKELPAWISRLLAFNPVLVLVRGYRAVLLEGTSPWTPGMVALWIGSAAVAILGYAWFHRLRKSFADVI
ncbi:MAG: ABC transporter permease [Acidobacteriota bacterium]